MKFQLGFLLLTLAFSASTFNLHSQGYIVPNGIINYTNYTGPGTEIDVLYNPMAAPPTTGDYTGFFLIPQNGTTFSYDYIVNVGVRTFLVSSGDPVSLQPIQSGNYTELLSGSSYVFDEGSPFYVGLYTGRGLPTGGIYPDPLFGWAKLENIGGTIQLLDSALEYKGSGIYAGTQNIIPVPEPAVFAFVTLSGVVFSLFHKRGR